MVVDFGHNVEQRHHMQRRPHALVVPPAAQAVLARSRDRHKRRTGGRVWAKRRRDNDAANRW